MEEYVPYTYEKSAVTTIGLFVDSSNSIISTEWKTIDFLLYSPSSFETSFRNIDNIYVGILQSSLEEEEKDKWYKVIDSFNKNTSSSEYNEMPIFNGVTLNLLTTKLNRYNTTWDSKNQVIVDPSKGDLFIVKALKELIENPLYQVKKILFDQQKITQFSPRIKVWLWSRTLSLESNKEIIINLTPFIENLNISTNGSSPGSWNFSLPPIPGKWVTEKGWIIDEKLVSFSIQNNQLSYTGKTNIDSGNTQQQPFFFERVIQKNDVVFISFEPLDGDKEIERTSYLISKTELASNVYDMIGVVTTNSISKIESNNSVNLSINGGDLLTVLNDDNFYFYPGMYLLSGLNCQGMDKAGLLRSDNKLVGYVTIAYKSLSTILQFVMNALSTIEITSKELFSSYSIVGENGGEGRTTYFKLPGSLNSEEEGFGQNKPVNGIWQIIKIIIDEQVQNRYLVNGSIGNTSSTALANIQQVAQEPFVQLLADTYLNQYYLTIRQAPWNKKGYKRLAKIADNSFNIQSEDVLSDNLSWNNDEVFSWYQLNPTGLTGGTSKDSIWAFLQAVRFPEYATIWGEKILNVTSNYIRVTVESSYEIIVDTAKLYEQAVRDLKFLVDCYAYMPFTRKGSIVVKGDRKYKKGLVVYHELTDEYFYVEGVSQLFSSNMTNDRTTTLTVSRGMTKEWIDSYFKIIKTPISEKDFKINVDGSSEIGSQSWIKRILGSWKVDKTIFDFFLKRRQFNSKILKPVKGGGFGYEEEFMIMGSENA